MTALTRQWVQKAEADYDAVLILRRSRKPTRFDIIRFHCQQCAEKYLKAKLQEASIRFGKTHDLESLLTMVLVVEPTWHAMRAGLSKLTEAAVEFRYPDLWASAAEAKAAFSTCSRLRSAARKSLGLKT